MSHYTKEDLELYRNHKMSVLGRIACATHLKDCPKCKKLLKELEDDDKLIKDLRNSLATFAAIEQQFASNKKSASTVR